MTGSLDSTMIHNWGKSVESTVASEPRIFVVLKTIPTNRRIPRQLNPSFQVCLVVGIDRPRREIIVALVRPGGWVLGGIYKHIYRERCRGKERVGL